MDLSVIVPAYEEGNVIHKSLSNLVSMLNSLGVNYEIMVVDDGSTDNTLDEIKKIEKRCSRISHITYPENKGKGNALKRGVEKVSGEYICFLDADSEIDLNKFKNFIDVARDAPADIVVGTKYHKFSKNKFPLYRKFLGNGYRYFNKILFNLSISDTQTGLKLFKKKVIKDIIKITTLTGFAFDLELLVIANKLSYSCYELPVSVNFTNSDIGLGDIFDIAKDTLKVAIKLYFSRRYNEATNI